MTNSYGREIKKRLIDRGMTQKELMTKVTEMTGLKMDSGYMSKILSGERNPPKIIHAINQILELEVAQ